MRAGGCHNLRDDVDEMELGGIGVTGLMHCGEVTIFPEHFHKWVSRAIPGLFTTSAGWWSQPLPTNGGMMTNQ